MRRRNLLDVLAELMRGAVLTRRTVAAMGVSLPTADRWLSALVRTIPGVLRARRDRTTVYVFRPKVVAPMPCGCNGTGFKLRRDRATGARRLIACSACTSPDKEDPK